MTLAIESARAARTPHRGWRPRYPGELPTLGWEVLGWATAHLPSPRDERQPLRLTDEQARRVLRIYEIDPVTGRRLVRRVHEEEAKGWGKGPFAGFLMLAEFRGPVLFDGWDSAGRPVGRPWGTYGSPAPWIQAAAVSEAQTANVWTSMYALLRAREGKIADALHIDEGRTRLYATDMAGAFMERVTASAGSREGQPITHAVVDEVQLLDSANGGDVLTRTILRNLTKTDGWAHFTGNAPVVGAETVAEEWWNEEGPGVYRFATRPQVEPQEQWPDEQKLAALREVYRDVPWMLDHADRILADVNEPIVPWAEKLRYSFNVRVSGHAANPWMPPALWDDAGGEVELKRDVATYAVIRVAHDHRTAAVAAAQVRAEANESRQREKIIHLTVRTFPENPADVGEYLDLATVEDHLRELRRDYPALIMQVKRYHPRGREHRVPRRGPEFAYHGAFFEGSKQKLEREGLVFVDVPSTHARLVPAAEALMAAVIEGRLVHDAGNELSRQIGEVEAREAAKGWTLTEAGPAARAAMLVVQNALTAEPVKPPRMSHTPPKGARP